MIKGAGDDAGDHIVCRTVDLSETGARVNRTLKGYEPRLISWHRAAVPVFVVAVVLVLVGILATYPPLWGIF